MNRGRILRIVILSAILVSGCSRLPGLQVLTGQNAQDGLNADVTVQALDLVMADKSGSTDSGLTAAANRIEAADNMLDIIEVRKDLENRVLTVSMLFNPPQTDTSTLDGQVAQYDYLRRAFEVTWQGMMGESDGTDRFDVRFLAVGAVPTLDHGRSFIGQIVIEGAIDRSAAAAYLAGTRDLNNFYDMVVKGTLDYQRPNDFVPYQGTPNHPMFMISAQSGQ